MYGLMDNGMYGLYGLYGCATVITCDHQTNEDDSMANMTDGNEDEDLIMHWA